jgi:hypothetical protein
MFTEQEEKAFVVVDKFLNDLTTSDKRSWFNTYAKPTEYFLAKELMDKYHLITYRAPGSKTSIVDIGDNGLRIIKAGGIKKYLQSINEKSEEKENLELQQLRTNVQILVDQRSDYLKDRKRFIRNEYALWIGILISLIALLISIFAKK